MPAALAGDYRKAAVVTHCICARQSFADVLSLARRAGWTTTDEIAQATGCGVRCGLCRPYLQATLESGQTCFLPGWAFDRGRARP